MLFYAERVWEHIAHHSSSGALKMESDLAALAELVLVVVESPGTFAELGAFSLVEPLRRKLLPIVDAQFRNQESFLSTGPLRWIDQESLFKPTIYVPFPRILEAVDEVEERIRRIPKPETTRMSDLASSQKHLLFFICDLVGVISPATFSTIEYFLRRIVPTIATGATDVPTLIGLGVAMGLLQASNILFGGKTDVFVATTPRHSTNHPFHHTRYLDLPSQRADHQSVLMTIPEARSVLEQYWGSHDS